MKSLTTNFSIVMRNFLTLLSMSEIIGHHRICRTRWWSDEDSNIMRVDRKDEQKMHNHQWVRLFHEKLIGLIDHWHTWDVIKEARERVRDIIQEMWPEMYERSAVKNFDKFSWNFDKRKGLYVPKPYNKDKYG